MANPHAAAHGVGKRCLDLLIPPSVLVRRGGISFGSSTTNHHESQPRMDRRGAVSYDNEDIHALYIRRLGDVHIERQANRLERYILNTLGAGDRKLLQGLSSKGRFTRYRSLSTTCAMRRGKRYASSKTDKLSVADDISFVDDYYKSSNKCLMDRTSDWAFDVFSLEHMSNGRPLFCLVIRLFQEHNLIQQFDLDIVKLMKFASMVEQGYHHNPYHNSIHAADVTQAMHCYILQEKIARHLTPLETLASLVSAITHDLDHPGVNQAFLIATSNHLATLYKNTSVLENHHWRTAVGILSESGLFDHLAIDEQEEIVRQMKSLILATDMTRQQEFYTKLSVHVAKDDLDMRDADDRHFILQIALKCADISNPCRGWQVCRHWSKRVCDEFFQQGDYERKLALPITNLCDRHKYNVVGIQKGFIDYVVKPLFAEFDKFLPCELLSVQLDNLNLNRTIWESANQLEGTRSGDGARLECSDMIRDALSHSDCGGDGDTSDSTASLHSAGSSTDDMADLINDNASFSQSNFNDLPLDITSNIQLFCLSKHLQKKSEFTSRRRSSLPTSETGLPDAPPPTFRHGRRESCPATHDNQLLYLPLNYHAHHPSLANTINRCGGDVYKPDSIPALGVITAESRLSTLCPSIEISKITSYVYSQQRLVH